MNKLIKRALAILLVVTIVGASFVGCGSKETKSDVLFN